MGVENMPAIFGTQSLVVGIGYVVLGPFIEFPERNYWIDGSDSEQEGHFVYLDGTPMKMGTPFWDNVEPNGGTRENCVELRSQVRYFMNDDSCGATKKVICEEVVFEETLN